MSLIKVINVKKSYKLGNEKVLVIKKANLTVNLGDFVAIIGKSGSGKSTLLNLLGTLDKPDDGEILIDNTKIFNLSDSKISKFRNEKIGFVFQSFNLINYLTVYENVELPILYSKNRKNIKEKVLQALEYVGLTHRLNHLPNQISGGEKQRVAIARAIVNNPQILLADEPTGNLDSKNTKIIMELFEKLNKEQNITIVMVTHDLETTSFCNKVLQMKDGILEESSYGYKASKN